MTIKTIQKYYLQNRDKILIQRKEYYNSHKDEILERNKKYYIDNKERINLYQKNYQLNNRQKLNEQARKYYLDKKKIILRKHRLYVKDKRKINIGFKILCNLRKRIWSVLKGNDKSKKTINLIGCNINFLKNYLENQFKPGMSWLNYSYRGWHIDHIRPCASFDLSKPSQQRKCFNYTNLQPLWAKDNLKKRNKYVFN